jgi:hypothetical protein
MSRRRVGLGKILFHTIMTFITGGLWLVGLFIWFLVSNSR